MHQNIASTAAGEEVAAALSAVFDAWESNDAATFVEWYEDDATIALPGQFMQGKDELRRTMEGAFAGPFQGSRRLVELDPTRFLGGHAAVVTGRSAVISGADPDPATGKWSRATWTLHRHAEGWRIAAYHECAGTLLEDH